LTIEGLNPALLLRGSQLPKNEILGVPVDHHGKIEPPQRIGHTSSRDSGGCARRIWLQMFWQRSPKNSLPFIDRFARDARFECDGEMFPFRVYEVRGPFAGIVANENECERGDSRRKAQKLSHLQ
jgi:hypothetical protein